MVKFCDCTQPLGKLIDSALKMTDSAAAIRMIDSVGIQMIDSECFKKLKDFEGDLKPISRKSDNEEYLKQLIDYLNEKHPFCVLLLLGRRGVIKEGNNYD